MLSAMPESTARGARDGLRRELPVPGSLIDGSAVARELVQPVQSSLTPEGYLERTRLADTELSQSAGDVRPPGGGIPGELPHRRG
jgi:hypothetical protein